MILEFGGCKREDLLDYNNKTVKRELKNCLTYPEEAIALKVVDEESGRIAGYAVWGWSPKVSESPLTKAWRYLYDF